MNQVLFVKELQENIKKALEVLSIVAETLGPDGRSIMIKSRGEKIVTKDGATVLKNLKSKDALLNYVLDYIREPSIKSAKDAGDGTTTTAIFLKTFFDEFFNRNMDFSEVLLALRDVRECVNYVLDFLRQKSTSISSIEDIYNIALLSSNGDEQIAKLISTSLEKIGIGGTISIVESNTNETKVELVEGFRIDSGYLSHEFVNDAKRQMVKYDNSKIMIVDGEFAAEPNDMLPILEKVYRSQSSLVVIAENFSKDMMAMFIGNAVRGKMQVCLVQAPMYGQERKELLMDIAIVTGAKLINPLKDQYEKIELTHLGSCKRFQATHKETIIMDGAADHDLLEEHTQTLNERLEELDIGPDAEKINARLERLSSGVAVIKIGGFSEMEVAERKFGVEDALEAVRAALSGGTVPGGCVMWLSAVGRLEAEKSDLSQTIGFRIFKEVLLSPFKTLCKNSGLSFGCIRDKMNPDEGFGFDFRTKNYVSMEKVGLIEPVKVLESSLLNSFSLFETLIKSGGAIFIELEDE